MFGCSQLEFIKNKSCQTNLISFLDRVDHWFLCDCVCVCVWVYGLFLKTEESWDMEQGSGSVFIQTGRTKHDLEEVL